MFRLIEVFAKDETAAVAIEYALIAIIVSVAILASILQISSILANIFSNLSQSFASALGTK